MSDKYRDEVKRLKRQTNPYIMVILLLVLVTTIAHFIWFAGLPSECDEWCYDMHIDGVLLGGLSMFIVQPSLILLGLFIAVWERVKNHQVNDRNVVALLIMLAAYFSQFFVLGWWG